MEGFKTAAAQLEQDLAALRAKQARIKARHAGREDCTLSGGKLFSSLCRSPPKIAEQVANFASYFIKNVSVHGEMTLPVQGVAPWEGLASLSMILRWMCSFGRYGRAVKERLIARSGCWKCGRMACH
ncbi:MAG: hypothetical protein IPP17_30335 [Bacteroidetes bacterium]|nr:hypothetical protein [Bacteroidota bacterium]